MMSRVYSACPLVVAAVPVTVEADVQDNLLKASIIGLPDAATRGSKDRLIPAITNRGFALHTVEIVINLGPAGLRKEETAYDLAMAIGIMVSKGAIPCDRVEDTLLLGDGPRRHATTGSFGSGLGGMRQERGFPTPDRAPGQWS